MYTPSTRSNVNANINKNNTNNNAGTNNHNDPNNVNGANTTTNSTRSFMSRSKRQSSQNSQRNNTKRILTVEDKNNNTDSFAQKTQDNDVEIVIENGFRGGGSIREMGSSSRNSENCRQLIESTRNQDIEGYEGEEDPGLEEKPFIACNSKSETHMNDLNKINEKLINFANKQTAITNNNSTRKTSATSTATNSSDESKNHKVWI